MRCAICPEDPVSIISGFSVCPLHVMSLVQVILDGGSPLHWFTIRANRAWRESE